MQQTDRYRTMKQDGISEDDIKKEFMKPVEMTVFSWNGPVDTIMSPLDSVRYHKMFLRTAFMSMDTHTGHVKAYVGGIDYNKFQYDMVTGGRRQIGSTMKPFLYSLAMIEGISPCDRMLHVQQQLMDENGRPWIPRNADQKHVGEMVSIQWGLQNSSNWVTAYLMKQLSPYTLVRLLHSFGMTGNIDPVISLSLGTPDISVSEMVGGYSTFANGGIRVEPLYVTHIEDSFGNIVATFNPQMHEVLPEDATYKMLYMLRSVMDGGTGSRVRFRYNLRAPMGGKTGTTQNNSDGWFMAFTPSLVSGCWVGGEDRSIHFDRMTEGQGASMALPIYALFMQKVYSDPTLGYSEAETFDIPNAYLNPCQDTEFTIPNGGGGIDKMFE
jgi:penicillin-binding protein 1A